MTNRIARRDAMRAKNAFPYGKFVGLLTAAFVTLVGVYMQLEPITILMRSTVSAIVIGTVVSVGVSIVRLADAENPNQKQNVGRG
ncbi:hypothetical protein [Planctomycetes bacterium K23_9]|uniref:Uncharacterized protein n=1 Tax=Stieleria marina TaxID=1930275 RepID=A0A517NT19_9BACT|nr:hypothetical protein K239x_22190 [Planctomycetes bacterium K23_9]